jgi:vancomycin resistance protein YoaR
MKKLLLTFGGVVVATGIGLGIVAARFEPVIRPNVSIGIVPVGGLTREEAAKKLRLWWETERRTEVELSSPLLKAQPKPLTLTAAGLVLDDKASIAQIPLEEFWDSVERKAGLEGSEAKRYDVVYKLDPKQVAPLEEFVERNGKPFRPARVKYSGGALLRQEEIAGVTLDESRMAEAALAAVQTGKGELPIVTAEKRVPDEALAQISEVMSTYTTSFSTRKVTRCANIRLAASMLDGLVLMPGERFSFNGSVGRRTRENGFKVAGVYKNGKHDVDIGGGICQVSTTLYNAALLSNLEIKVRSPHSMPVPYVPLGRDATVDFGSQDLAFVNNTPGPIAISSHYQPGRLTFRVLGKKEPGLSVKITTSGRKTWSAGVKYVHDGSLPPGKSKVVDAGGMAGSVNSFRSVYRYGQLVKRESLGRSHYRGGTRIVARNTNPAPAPSEIDAPAEQVPISAPPSEEEPQALPEG